MLLLLDFGTFHVTLSYRPVRVAPAGATRQPDGSVHVSAPARILEAAVRAWVLKKQAWTTHHQAAFRARPQPVARQYVSGKLHYVPGCVYLLRVSAWPGSAQVTLTEHELHLALGRKSCKRPDWVAG